MDMDNGNEVANRLERWSDLASLVLLGFALAAGDLTPRRPVWGRSSVHRAAITVTMLALAIWTGFRFVYEGINVTAPREFLAVSVVYLARWCYLMLRISLLRCKEARLFRVARALREVHNLRVGRNSEPPQNNNDNREDPPQNNNGNNREDPPQGNMGEVYGTRMERPRVRGEWEVVLRKGVRKATDCSRPYWRGFMDPAPRWHDDEQAWDVILWEEGMHKYKLDIFGTKEYVKESDDISETAYSRFYKVVITAIATPTARRPERPEQLPHIEVDFTEFTDQWSGLGAEFLARSVGATDDRPIGYIARRIAADAVAYVDGHKKFGTDLQVACLNRCLNQARRAHFAALQSSDSEISSPPGENNV